MVAEGACVVQLEGIVEFAVGAVDVGATCLGRPVDGVLHLVDTRTRIRVKLIVDLTCARIYPHLLGVIVHIIDTALALHEVVVHGEVCLELQPFGQHGKVLFQNKVGRHLGRRTLFRTGCCQNTGGVGDIGITRGIPSPHAIGVDRTHGVRCRFISRSPVGLVVVRHLPRQGALGIRTEEVGRELRGLRQREVQVTADVDTVVAESGVIAAVVLEGLEQVTFAHEVGSRKILHHLRTARHVDTRVVRHGVTLEEVVLPVDVGVTVPLFGICRIAVLVDDGSRRVVRPAGRIDGSLTLNGVVHQVERVIGIILLGQLRHHLGGHVRLDLHVCLSFFTTLGRDEDDTVGTLHTIDGCCRCVLEDGDAFHRRDVDRAHLTLDSVDEHQRFAIVPGALRTDDDFRVLIARHT